MSRIVIAGTPIEGFTHHGPFDTFEDAEVFADKTGITGDWWIVDLQSPAPTKWDDNSIQFPRLIAEIVATQELDLPALAASMDLTVGGINELFDRADFAWEQVKADIR